MQATKRQVTKKLASKLNQDESKKIKSNAEKWRKKHEAMGNKARTQGAHEDRAMNTGDSGLIYGQRQTNRQR